MKTIYCSPNFPSVTTMELNQPMEMSEFLLENELKRLISQEQTEVAINQTMRSITNAGTPSVQEGTIKPINANGRDSDIISGDKRADGGSRRGYEGGISAENVLQFLNRPNELVRDKVDVDLNSVNKLFAINLGSNLKKNQNAVITSYRTNSNNSGQQSFTGEQGQSDKNSIHSAGLDTGTENDVRFSNRRLGQESSTDSENTSQRTEDLGRPREERLSLLDLLDQAKQ